ncbi:hypothetical protein PACTADRAFT_633 [Pachysolen tannophilus NRRL Y-2460]|uniref:Uncharacterized protein n=1 Tax=Pachysolen tannophilus NRRL Y-2460 TaxID=669874 RepID=A0A1E4U2M2_PACTA|nr:hypothetical protein PACTADRAFT_633 [Pachysolen tannophilus NRRL Y-2460]
MSSSIKQRQLRHLNSQFQTLEKNLNDFNSLIKITKLQADSIRKLGLIHGSLLMSANRVFENEEEIKNNHNTSNLDSENNDEHSSSIMMPDEE